MAYIGRQNLGGAYRQLDDISSGFDGSDTTHTMQVNSQNVTVGDVNQIILSLGGVIQKPGTDFTVSGSTLTFTTAPAANTSFFAILLGSDNGGTVTPTDASVTSAKLSGNLVTPGTLDVNGQELILDADADTSITADTDDQVDIKVGGTDRLRMAGNNIFLNGGTDARIQLGSGGSGANTVGNDTVHIRGDGDSMKLMAAANGEYVFENNGTAHMNIDASGHITKPLQPAFNALVGSTQTFNNNTNTTVVFVTERYDTNGDFASNTFTAPVTGKYLLSYGIYFMDVDTDMVYVQNEITTSNRTYYNAFSTTGFDATNQYWNLNQTVVADMDANDTAVVKVYFNAGSALRADGSSFFSGALLS